MARASTTGVRGLFRAGKRWQIDLRWREPGTGEARRYRESLPSGVSAAAAKSRAREILDSALAGGFDPRKAKPKRLEEALAEYAKWCESNRPKAAKQRAATCARLLAGIGDRRVDEVAPFHVERFKRERLRNKLRGGKAKADGTRPTPPGTESAPGTVNRDLEILSHAFGLFASWGMVTSEQARGVQTVPHLKEPPGRVRYLSPDEETLLFAKLSPGVRPIVLAALLSGMRQSEVVTLTKDAVDLAAGMITLTTTKANKVRRVYVNAALAEVLREAMAASPGSFVFANAKGKRYTCDGVRCLFRRAVENAGLGDFRFHDLRHTTATRLRRGGSGLDTVAAVLGHATLAMAARYAHIGSADLRAAMDSLPVPAKLVATKTAGQIVPFTSETKAG
jgi:integrase